MKDEKNYATPEMEIIEFETEDVITTSGGNGSNPNETPIEWIS